MEIKDRIEQFRIGKKMNVSEFERATGMSNGNWAKSKDIKEETLLKVIKVFPEIDAEWLLRGTDKDSETASVNKLIEFCRLLSDNYKQRDEIMSGLVAILNKIEVARYSDETPTDKNQNKK